MYEHLSSQTKIAFKNLKETHEPISLQFDRL